MTITYAAPIAQPNVTSKRLVHFVADPVARRILCDYEIGYVSAGVFVPVSTSRRIFTDDTIPSFANFVAACPAAVPLRNQVETYEITLDRPGTAD